MLTRLTGGRIYDPASGVDGEIHDLYIRDGLIVEPPRDAREADEVIDVRGRVVMAGAIDLHTHIGGGKVNIARMMLPEDHVAHATAASGQLHSGCGHAAPSTWWTGYRYAEMGYTACFEPAMLPANARQTHMEMADTPVVDKGAYVLLGNNDLLLRMIADGTDQKRINDLVAWTIESSQALAVKVVNPGGINAFKFNQRRLDLDEENAGYGITPRQILLTLATACRQIGLTHPLHVHGCNLGVPGNVETTLATIQGSEGLPLHLTHVQFHSYGAEGDRKFSSGAAAIAEAVNANPNISVDVGQIMFGQTVTESGDSMMQYAGSAHAHPKKWTMMDLECDAGCGVVPFRYRDKNFVNALQWAIGLELFLLVDDPWRIFLTTDHPNGAPFTSYPHLTRLLMDRSFRLDMLKTIHPDAAAASNLAAIDREYTMEEIAIMTRAAPARSLGLDRMGHLGPGAQADVCVYRENANYEAMFKTPEYVFKRGDLVASGGSIIEAPNGVTHVARAPYDSGIKRTIDRYFDQEMSIKASHMIVSDDEITELNHGSLAKYATERTA
ncbi:MAG: formylmethanofuran dehydrogenase subunit A [Gammaproteobacteria bacterium]|nr:formylmethanofuran dehydrogenase subunit A [Gammaproteobacteria bacterium]